MAVSLSMRTSRVGSIDPTRLVLPTPDGRRDGGKDMLQGFECDQTERGIRCWWE